MACIKCTTRLLSEVAAVVVRMMDVVVVEASKMLRKLAQLVEMVKEALPPLLLITVVMLPKRQSDLIFEYVV
jgi:hypothetical protein